MVFKFRFIGAYSSSFGIFTKETWDDYFYSKNFYGKVPYIYLFCGGNKHDTTERRQYPAAVAMEGWLLENGYPGDKMINIIDKDGTHSEGFWALYFPEMLSYGLNL